MIKDKRGFIAISVVYSFFLVFLMLLLIILNTYLNNRTSFDIYKDNIKVKAALYGYKYNDKQLSLTEVIEDQIKTTKNLNSGVNYDPHGNYRYFGQAPNNYIYFGKLGNSCNDERYLFRIVGVFNESNVAASVAASGGSGYVTKVVRAKPLARRRYNSTTSNNLWRDSELKTYLNGAYLNNPLESNFEDLFKDKLIIDAKWYAPQLTKLNVTSAEAYNLEMNARGNYLSTGKIGLLSISDWGYASKSIGACDVTTHKLNEYNYGLGHKCHAYNWLNDEQWFIDGFTSPEGLTLGLTLSAISPYYNNLTNANVTSTKAVYPTFYINSKAIVMAGTGTKVDPYIINLFEV